jgi:hypothetical protein
VAELEIWEQLLKESYDAALDKLSTLDRQHPTPEAALPLFEAAHRAWQGRAGRRRNANSNGRSQKRVQIGPQSALRARSS